MSECWTNFHYIGMLHIFARVIGYAQLIACIRIKIGATEVALEAAEAVKGDGSLHPFFWGGGGTPTILEISTSSFLQCS